MTNKTLIIENLQVCVDGGCLLKEIDLSYGETGFYIIMGPVGVGKSTLLSVFDGTSASGNVTFDANNIMYCGREVSESNKPVVIKQATREEQKLRLLTAKVIREKIDDALKHDPKMLCLDEPCATVSHEEAIPILELLKGESKKRVVLMVTHNSEHARLFADWMVLLGGGCIVEQNTPEVMFNTPNSTITESFLRTGSMALPRPDAKARTLAPEFRGMPDIGQDISDTTSGPLRWVVRNSFAVSDVLSDNSPEDLVGALLNNGVNIVLSGLNENTDFVQKTRTSGVGIWSVAHLLDEQVRDVRECISMAEKVQNAIAYGHKVVVVCEKHNHSKMIAAIQLINMGITVEDAIALTNSKLGGQPVSIKDEQFLWDLELVLDMDSAPDQCSNLLSIVSN